MNDFARRMVADRRYTKSANPPGYDRRYNHDMRRPEHMSRYEDDGRRGVKYTGRYGIGGSMYHGDRYREYPDYGEDYGEYDGYDDGGASEEVSLTQRELKRWADKLRNADGTDGAHFTKDEVRKTAERVGARYDRYSEDDLWMAANMMYSDYSEVLRPILPSDTEAMTYVKLGKAFLEDKDAPHGSEKLAMYYFCIVDDENAR